MKTFKSKRGLLLDVGCKDRKQANFIGIDNQQRPGVDIVHDLESFPYPLDSGSCLTIKCVHVIEHIKPWLFFPFMNELWRLLAPNGQLMISAPYAGSLGYWQDPTHCLHLTEGSWTLFDPDFPLYAMYKPKPWKLEHSAWKSSGNIEAILTKRDIKPAPVGMHWSLTMAEKAISLGALQKTIELGAFLDLISNNPPKTVVEIGTASGGLLYALCKTATPDATIISIDLPGGEFGVDYSAYDVNKFKTYAGPKQKLSFIKGDSHKLSTLSELTEKVKGKVDLLVIDGDHTYKGVKRDWLMYKQLVRDGGIIAFHDICYHKQHPSCEVNKLWEEIKQSPLKTIEYIDPNDTGWGGIGIVFYKGGR